MQQIACISWGSLRWDPRTLPVGRWFPNGPLLPLEFARHSLGDRVTVVLTPRARKISTAWARLAVNGLDEAVAALRVRENIPEWNDRWIGRWSRWHPSESPYADLIAAWAVGKDLDGVVWTALPPKWEGEPGRVPTARDVLALLEKWQREGKSANAEKYIRTVPPETATQHRAAIEKRFGWAAQ